MFRLCRARPPAAAPSRAMARRKGAIGGTVLVNRRPDQVSHKTTAKNSHRTASQDNQRPNVCDRNYRLPEYRPLCSRRTFARISRGCRPAFASRSRSDYKDRGSTCPRSKSAAAAQRIGHRVDRGTIAGLRRDRPRGRNSAAGPESTWPTCRPHGETGESRSRAWQACRAHRDLLS